MPLPQLNTNGLDYSDAIYKAIESDRLNRQESRLQADEDRRNRLHDKQMQIYDEELNPESTQNQLRKYQMQKYKASAEEDTAKAKTTLIGMYAKSLPTVQAGNYEDMQKFHKYFLSQGMDEGLMRNPDSFFSAAPDLNGKTFKQADWDAYRAAWQNAIGAAVKPADYRAVKVMTKGKLIELAVPKTQDVDRAYLAKVTGDPSATVYEKPSDAERRKVVATDKGYMYEDEAVKTGAKPAVKETVPRKLSEMDLLNIGTAINKKPEDIEGMAEAADTYNSADSGSFYIPVDAPMERNFGLFTTKADPEKRYKKIVVLPNPRNPEGKPTSYAKFKAYSEKTGKPLEQVIKEYNAEIRALHGKGAKR